MKKTDLRTVCLILTFEILVYVVTVICTGSFIFVSHSIVAFIYAVLAIFGAIAIWQECSQD